MHTITKCLILCLMSFFCLGKINVFSQTLTFTDNSDVVICEGTAFGAAPTLTGVPDCSCSDLCCTDTNDCPGSCTAGCNCTEDDIRWQVNGNARSVADELAPTLTELQLNGNALAPGDYVISARIVIGGIEGPSISLTYTVSAAPTLGVTSASSFSICQGENFAGDVPTLTCTANPGCTCDIVWTEVGVAGTISVGNPLSPTLNELGVNGTQNSPGSRTFRATLNGDQTEDFIYTVSTAPTLGVTSPTSFSICQGENFGSDRPVVTCTANPGCTCDIVWTEVGVAGTIPVGNPLSPNLSELGLNGNQDTPFSRTFRATLNGVQMADFNYSVNLVPQINNLVGLDTNSVVCLFSENQISVDATNTTGNYTFRIEKIFYTNPVTLDPNFTPIQFDNIPGFIFSPDSLNMPLLFRSAIDETSYLLTVTGTANSSECNGGSNTVQQQFPFFVEPGPLAFFNYERNTVFCRGESIQFTLDSLTLRDLRPGFAPGEYQYIFNFGDGDVNVTNQILGRIIPEADFNIFNSYPDFGTYQVSLRLEPNDGSTCNGIWAEEINIGNPFELTPEFVVNNLRASNDISKPTRFSLVNNEQLKPANKIWYFDVFLTPFNSNSFTTNFGSFRAQSLIAPSSNNVEVLYNDPGVYLLLYYNRGGSPINGFKFCSQFYGLPLTIFGDEEVSDLSSWVSSSYIDTVLASSTSILTQAGVSELSAETLDLSSITTQNSSWQLRSQQSLDSAMQVGVNGAVWITDGDLNAYNNDERSWVQSQFFSLDTITSPFLSLKVWIDTQPRLDGAVLEYTLGDEEIWHRLGNDENVGEDTEWYNARGIAGAPGDQSGENLGWSGQNARWQLMRFPLSNIKDSLEQKFADVSDRVLRFRISFASIDNLNLSKGTFAFGEIRVEDADRIVLFENFVGDTPSSVNDQSSIQALVENDDFALQVNYYTDPNDSGLYRNSPQETSVSALRELYYNTGGLETTVMDGQRGVVDTLTERFSRRKLDFTPYLISSSITTSPLTFNGVIEKKDTTTFSNEHRLRVALVERGVEIDGVLHRNVVRRMYPSPQGTALPEDFSQGQIFMLPSAIEFPNDISHTPITTDFTGVDEADLNNFPYMLVFFVQDIETREILQTHTVNVAQSDIGGRFINTPGTPVNANQTIKIYPNPGDEYMNLNLGEDVIKWDLINAWGKTLVSSDTDQQSLLKKQENSSILKLDSQRLPAGYYFLIIEDKNLRKTVKKLIVIH